MHTAQPMDNNKKKAPRDALPVSHEDAKSEHVQKSLKRKKRTERRKPTLRSLITGVTFVPIMTLSVIFGYTHIASRLNDLERNALHHTQATLQTLAAIAYQHIAHLSSRTDITHSASDNPVINDAFQSNTNDLKTELQSVLNQAMTNPHIRAVSLHYRANSTPTPTPEATSHTTPHTNRSHQTLPHYGASNKGPAPISLTSASQPLLHAGPPMLPLSPSHAKTQHHIAKQLENTNWQYPQQSAYFTGSTFRLIAPVFPALAQAPQLVVEIEADLSRLTATRYEIIATGITLMISGAILSLLAGILLSAQLRGPIKRLEKRLATLSEGDFEYAPEQHFFAEWRHLDKSIQRMVNALRHEHDELQHSASQATEDLRQTLETIEIQNIELDLARKEALEASRVKSEFLANISHEIRTPLNGIIGFTKLLLKTPLASKHREYLDTIHKSSEGLLTIINDILDFSKIEAGKLALEHITFDLRETIEDALTMVSPLAHEKNLELINLFFAEPSIPLLGDPLRIKQVVTNLVNNAIKFTDHGCVTVRTTTESTADHHLVLKISVTDTGIGLTVDEQNNLFKAFNQGDTSSARKYGGTGLGLVICKHLVRQMSGDIGFHSEYQTGSTFWFTLKLGINHNSSFYTGEPSLANRRVLVFDSNPLVRLSLRNSLENSKIRVEEVDALNAIFPCLGPEHQGEQRVDAVILGRAQERLSASDISDLVQLIEEQYHRKCIVLCTTHERYQLQSRLNLAPGQIISKPVPHPKLYAALEHALLEPSPYVEHDLLTHAAFPVEAENSGGRKVHALCVDDNPSNLTLVRVSLEDLGVRVTTCDNGVKALEAIGKTSFDIIFMDIQMPRMDGVETTRKIRALESDEQTPIVALTAHALPSEKKGLFKAGMNEYITKPMNELQLIQILEKHTHYKHPSKKHLGVPSTQTKPAATKPITSKPIDSKPIATKPTRSAKSHVETSQTKDAVPTRRYLEQARVPVFDPTEHLKLSNHKEDLAEELLGMLIHSLTPTQQALQNAWENEDYEALLEHTHKLHGATRYCGVPALRQALHQLETLIKQRKLEKIPHALRHALEEITRLKTALTRREPDPIH